MKKIISLCVALLAMAIATPGFEAHAASKAAEKSAKTQAKKLTKEGWESIDDNTIEYGFIMIQEKKEAGLISFVGEAYDSKKASVAKQHARQDVKNQLAENGKTMIDARIKQELGDTKGDEYDNLMSAYDQKIKQALEAGVIGSPILTLVNNTQGNTQYRCYYMIDPNKLNDAYKSALNQAADEAGLRTKLGNEITNFIKSEE